jgi:hypothetical protein
MRLNVMEVEYIAEEDEDEETPEPDLDEMGEIRPA